eukprot:835125-Ditylum_brightwellii.AAC.1
MAPKHYGVIVSIERCGPPCTLNSTPNCNTSPANSRYALGTVQCFPGLSAAPTRPVTYWIFAKSNVSVVRAQ